ncbi:Uncharacterised protein [Burkholderia pseudomallei]|nr:Uncharacterised protein [Burkholderia pseudomallei]CAJ3140937.1 Uncharacterised protein [Burkholderia pseudomallei]CAJ8275771.1 Uncharacterised protein [Burkholderia pseudomallei]CAJ9607898.1 Uncharacterised protein [Burkholderia pseudomallei]CAJ9752197.1 Uncharacterised protein [Burkholderia pseudomallei]
MRGGPSSATPRAARGVARGVRTRALRERGRVAIVRLLPAARRRDHRAPERGRHRSVFRREGAARRIRCAARREAGRARVDRMAAAASARRRRLRSLLPEGRPIRGVRGRGRGRCDDGDVDGAARALRAAGRDARELGAQPRAREHASRRAARQAHGRLPDLADAARRAPDGQRRSAQRAAGARRVSHPPCRLRACAAVEPARGPAVRRDPAGVLARRASGFPGEHAADRRHGLLSGEGRADLPDPVGHSRARSIERGDLRAMDAPLRQDLAASGRHRFSVGADRARRLQDERLEHRRVLARALRPIPARAALERAGGSALSGIRKQDD